MSQKSEVKIIILLIVLVIVTSACTEQVSRAGNGGTTELKVVVTFEALYEIATAVGGGKAEIIKIIPDGAEAHDFEPKAKDLLALTEAAVFIVNGLGLEPWAEQAVKAAKNSSLMVVDASDGIEAIALTEGGYDMHIWLSLRNAAVIAESISDAFCEADSDNAEYYSENLRSFTRELDDLHREYEEKFRTVAEGIIVTQHEVFAYLCRDYELTQKSIEGVYAEGEPSAKELARLVEYCRENGIKTIFTEEMSNSLLSETLANEAGATVKTVYTIEGYEEGLTYIQRMEKNLEAIYASVK